MVSNEDIFLKLDLLRSGKLSCRENVEYFLSEIKKINPTYNIYLNVLKEKALSRADELDALRSSGVSLGKFHGLVFAIKSNISVKGAPISCASKTLEGYEGSFDADVITTIYQEGGIILGIVNNDEFASGSSGETSAFGKTINPFSPSRIPGGSSSGSAAAVAANLCDISLGTDTGGSIRNPASHCGVVGIKPSFGRVSRYGLLDLSMSLDQIGPFSKDVFGASYVLEVLSGISENDATTLEAEVDSYSQFDEMKKYKIGVVSGFKDLVVDSKIGDIWKSRLLDLEAQGHELVEIDIKGVELAIASYYPIVYTEFFSGTRKFDGLKYGKSIEESCGPEVLRRILGGKEISKSEFDGAYYKKALKVKELLAKEFKQAFSQVDVIIAPTTPMLPHTFETQLSPEEMYAYDAFTIPANLAGICGGVVSIDQVEEDDGPVSVGLQVFADVLGEKTMCSMMKQLENLKK